jgi:hypothetical protein
MFRFTIRELVLVTLGVALGVGWWMERWTSREWRNRAEATARQLRTDHAVETLFKPNGTFFSTENTATFVPLDSPAQP